MASGHKVIKQAHRAKAGGVCVGWVGGGGLQTCSQVKEQSMHSNSKLYSYS